MDNCRSVVEPYFNVENFIIESLLSYVSKAEIIDYPVSGSFHEVCNVFFAKASD